MKTFVKWLSRKSRSIERLAGTDIKYVLMIEAELDRYEQKLRQAYEEGFITEAEFEQNMEDKERELLRGDAMSPKDI